MRTHTHYKGSQNRSGQRAMQNYAVAAPFLRSHCVAWSLCARGSLYARIQEAQARGPLAAAADDDG
jgi:hypothetical protein